MLATVTAVWTRQLSGALREHPLSAPLCRSDHPNWCQFTGSRQPKRSVGADLHAHSHHLSSLSSPHHHLGGYNMPPASPIGADCQPACMLPSQTPPSSPQGPDKVQCRQERLFQKGLYASVSLSLSRQRHLSPLLRRPAPCESTPSSSPITGVVLSRGAAEIVAT